MKEIAIYGAGGCGREVACIIELINQEKRVWNFIGFFDDGIKKGCHLAALFFIVGYVNGSTFA